MNRENDLQWRKSSRSAEEANCVETAAGPDGTARLRDSKNPDQPHLRLTPATWRGLLALARNR